MSTDAAAILDLDISSPSTIEVKHDDDTQQRWDVACAALKVGEQHAELLAIWHSVPEDGRLQLVNSIVAQEGLTALEQAVVFLRVETARALLQVMGATVDLNVGDRTAFFSAKFFKDMDTNIPFLMMAAFRSPFVFAVASNHVELARLLHEHGAPIELNWQHAVSFCSNACQAQNVQAVARLENLDTLLSCIGYSGPRLIRAAGHVLPRLLRTVFGDCTTLHIAAARDAVDSIKFLIEECKLDIEADSAIFGTPANVALYARSAAALDVLVNTYHCAVVNNETGDNLAMIATMTSSPAMLQLILAAHPELVYSTNSAGMTPLHLSAVRGSLDIIKVLMDAGADPCTRAMANSMHPAGPTPWDIANEATHRKSDQVRAALAIPRFEDMAADNSSSRGWCTIQ